jgi:release factor glutamine methyltransferase
MAHDAIDLAPGTTIAEARRIVSGALSANGADSPDLDARLLIGHALGLDHAALAANGSRALNATEAAVAATLATRRLAHEPVARILGSKEFWGLRFALGSTTLVPRPETETVVEAALDILDPRAQSLRIADLGTGTGALLVALLSELQNAIGIGTDISAAALAVAQANAARAGVSDRAIFVLCDFSDALASGFDCLVSNPPYIRSADIAGLSPDVRNYDPRLALDGGADGLASYRRIAAGARRALKPGGALIVELGAGQEEAVVSLMAAHSLRPESAARRDLAGIPRALTLRPLP